MGETWHEHYLRLLLPDELRKTCSVSLSIQRFLGMVEAHLLTIYGERADWKKNLEKFYHSEMFCSQYRIVENVDSIPELSIDDIKAWIAVEERFSSTILRLIDLLPAIENEIPSGDAIQEAGSLLGLLGPNPDAIYHWIVDWDGVSEKDIKSIEERILAHSAEFRIIISTLIKLCINGKLLTYPVLETVMTQQKTRYFYRGENAYYGSCKPSAFRWADKSKPEWLVQRVNALRRNEGCEFLDNFIATFAWPYSSTNHYALCQHYGLYTEMLDITSDVWAALFFATTRYEDGKWRPLKSDEIKKADSRKNVYNRGGDSRYGIIYRRLAEPVELEWLYKSENPFWDTIVPIGYQPYMRCAYQHAYGLFENSMSYDMYKDKNFGKYKIRLTEKLCNWVFEQTHQGKDVFPIDDIPDISGYLKKINETKRFSWDSFTAIMEGHQIPKNQWQRVQLEMFPNGYTIDRGRVSFISEEEVGAVNSAYPPERAKMLTTAEPISDPLIIITADEQSQKEREADDYKYRFMMINPEDATKLKQGS